MNLCTLLVLAGALVARPAAADDDFVLIDQRLDVTIVSDVVLETATIRYRDELGYHRSAPTTTCVALVTTARPPAPPAPGWLILADGQRIPGRLAPGAPRTGSALAWDHAWLDRLDVPLERIAAATFHPGARIPAPGSADVITLANGDRIEGFIESVGERIAIEVEEHDAPPQRIEIPFARAGAIALVTPKQDPSGVRVWFNDGTILDTRRLAVGDDGYVRLETPLAPQQRGAIRVQLSGIAGVLFDPDAMVPLAGLRPVRVESSAPRFVVPEPKILDDHAPLGVARVELRGPVLVRYTQPAGATRFAATATVPRAAAAWADFELVVKDDDRVVHRTRLTGASISVGINVPLSGSELTIELEQGAHGPVQDRVVLEGGMFLVD